jgi:Diadenosine tetraphosphate (Ap4A) hydrolase and other HIT family hydrolases
MEDTIFTKIIKGEIPCYKVAEDDRYFAFLDISPIARGHVLVVTKLQNDYIFDLPDDLLAGMMLFAKKVAIGLKKAVPCNRVGVAVIGIDVPHNHIHLVPINGVGDLNFKAERVKLTDEEFKEIAASIAASVEL